MRKTLSIVDVRIFKETFDTNSLEWTECADNESALYAVGLCGFPREKPLITSVRLHGMAGVGYSMGQTAVPYLAALGEDYANPPQGRLENMSFLASAVGTDARGVGDAEAYCSLKSFTMPSQIQSAKACRLEERMSLWRSRSFCMLPNSRKAATGLACFST